MARVKIIPARNSCKDFMRHASKKKNSGQRFTIIEWYTLFVLRFGSSSLIPPYGMLKPDEYEFLLHEVCTDLNGAKLEEFYNYGGKFISPQKVRNSFSRIDAIKRMEQREWAARQPVNRSSPKEEDNGATV